MGDISFLYRMLARKRVYWRNGWTRSSLRDKKEEDDHHDDGFFTNVDAKELVHIFSTFFPQKKNTEYKKTSEDQKFVVDPVDPQLNHWVPFSAYSLNKAGRPLPWFLHRKHRYLAEFPAKSVRFPESFNVYVGSIYLYIHPFRDASHHQNYYIYSREPLYKPSFCH